MKKAKFTRIIIASLLVVVVFCTMLFANPFAEGKLPFNSDCYTFILDGVTYSLPFKVSVFKENGWEILADENSRTVLGGHSCAEFEAVKGEKRVGVLVGNPDLSRQGIDNGNIVGIKFYFGSNADFLLRDDISYDFTKEQIISTFGLPTNEVGTVDVDKVVTLGYTRSSAKYDKAQFYFYSSVSEQDKAGLPAVSLYNFGELVFNVINENATKEELEYQEPDELGDDLTSGRFEFEGKIYSLPMRYDHFKTDWKIDRNFISLPSDTYYKELQLYHANHGIGIKAYLINDSDYVSKYDKATIYGFTTDYVIDCKIKFPGGLDISKKQTQMQDVLSNFQSRKNNYYTYYNYENNGFKIEVRYSNETDECLQLTVSKNADKYESEGRSFSDYGKKEFFNVTGEIKENDEIKPMKTTYTLSYLPKGSSMKMEKYRYKNFSVGKVYTFYNAETQENSEIHFIQEPIVSNRKINLYKKYWTRENNGLYVKNSELQMFFWEKDGYRFSIYADILLAKEEIYNMANSLMSDDEYDALIKAKKEKIKAQLLGKTKEEIEKMYGDFKHISSISSGNAFTIDGLTVYVYYAGDGTAQYLRFYD